MHITPLANAYTRVFESPDPARLFCFSPGLCALPGGRLVATFDLGGPGAAGLDGPKGLSRTGKPAQARVALSDDGGASWRQRASLPFMHARPFTAGGSLYVLGHCGDLMVARSDDGGETWSGPARLTEGGDWHQAPCNVHMSGGCVYIAMEKVLSRDIGAWPVSRMAPVLMRARVSDDLTRPDSWTFASELAAMELFTSERLDYFGVPFLPEYEDVRPGRANCAPIGWLETNIVQFTDPNHYLSDPDGRTLHLWMRAHTGGTGYAAIAKVVENADGTMTTMAETAPSGKALVFVPCPGGQMKFHILYDEISALYWLLSSQATDSMTRADKLDFERFDLPNNERHRLQLHFSKNCIDWCFAGLVAAGASPKQTRHYASMAVRGDDLLVLSRSGDERAVDAHNSNLITLHTIRGFRRLIY